VKPGERKVKKERKEEQERTEERKGSTRRKEEKIRKKKKRSLKFFPKNRGHAGHEKFCVPRTNDTPPPPSK